MSSTPEPARAPFISVIIPCWNAAAWVSEAIASCLDQEGVRVEAIVIDDASTDATPVIVKSMAANDSRIRIIRAQSNGGPSNARNLGVAAAVGEWIAFADSDDIMLPGRFARLARLGQAWNADFVADQQLETVYPATSGGVLAFERMGSMEAEAVSLADYIRLAREGNADVDRPPIRRSFGQLKPLIRRAFLERAGLEHDVRFRAGEDLHFHVRCLVAGAAMIYVNAPGYVYRRREDSLTYEDNQSYTRLIEMVDDLLKLRLDPVSNGYLLNLRYVWRSHAAYQDMRLAVQRRSYWKAFVWLLQSGPAGWVKFISLPVRLVRKRRGMRLTRMDSSATARRVG